MPGRFRRAAAAALLLLLAVSCNHEPTSLSEESFLPLPPKYYPAIPFHDSLTARDRIELGIEQDTLFTINDLKAEVVLLEFLNVSCRACQTQAPILSKVQKLVKSRHDLRGRVKILAVAAGNNAAEVEAFRTEYGATYPIMPDPLFSTYETIGNQGGLPFLMLYQLAAGSWEVTVVKTHPGLAREKRLVHEIEMALGLAESEKAYARRVDFGEWKNLTLSVSEAYIGKLLTASGAEIGFPVAKLRPIDVDKEDRFYRLTSADGKELWAKISGRSKICNICHDIFFIVLFDDAGTIVNFTPISVTKDKNVKWNEAEVGFMKRRLVGRNLSDPFVFDQSVDSVSTATMSSQLIFDAVRHLKTSFAIMRERELLGT